MIEVIVFLALGGFFFAMLATGFSHPVAPLKAFIVSVYVMLACFFWAGFLGAAYMIDRYIR